MILKTVGKILHIIFIVLKVIFVTYAIVFSIVGTIALIYAYNTVMKPIREVQFLVNHNPKETAYMKLYREELRNQKKPDSLYQRFVPLDSISKNLQNAVIAVEDDGFFTHPGIDIEAILKAAEYNRDKNKITRGASTITQQLAKNLFLDDERSFMRKVKELGYTLLLEKFLTKNRILELYLNYAEWGDNLFGCEGAAQRYYKKSSARLTLSESSRMAATLAMPSKITPLNTKSMFIQKRIEVIANNLYRRHILDDSGYSFLAGFAPPKDTGNDSIVFLDPVPSPSLTPKNKVGGIKPHNRIVY